jgi:anti-sigma factor RsiW
MTACDQSLVQLSPYLDDALPTTERGAVAAHLATCGACRTRLETLRALKHSIARLPSREEPPGAVRAHIDAMRFSATVPRRPWSALALSAVAVAAAAVFVIARRTDHGARLADELVADHLHSVPDVRPAEIASNDPAEVQRFFADHLPFSAVVPHLPGATLLGARLCKIEDRRVELLFYRHQDRTLSLFVTDAPVAGDRCWVTRDHHVCSRSKGELRLLLVGQLPADELSRLLNESAL